MELFNADAEKSLIRALADLSLSDPKRALEYVYSHGMTREHFYDTALESLYACCVDFMRQGKALTASTLWTALNGNLAIEKAGGLQWLFEVLNDPADAWEAFIPTYWASILEMSQRRELNETALRIQRRVKDAQFSVTSIVTDASSDVSRVAVGGVRSLKTARDYLVDDVLPELDRRHNEQKVDLLKTGLPSLDNVIGGLQKELILLGSQPSVGKSALMLTIAQNIARSGEKVGVFSLEDSGNWMAWRTLSQEAPIDQFVLRNRLLTAAQMERVGKAAEKLNEYADRILVEDACGLTADQISVKADEMIVRHGCSAIFVDHIGEIRHDKRIGDRFDLQVAGTLTVLRDIVKRHNIPVVVIWHLKRPDGGDEGTPPKVTDFANSASSERMARVAIGLSRPPESDRLRIDILKQTNGLKNVYIDIEFDSVHGMVRDDGLSRVRWSHSNDEVTR